MIDRGLLVPNSAQVTELLDTRRCDLNEKRLVSNHHSHYYCTLYMYMLHVHVHVHYTVHEEFFASYTCNFLSSQELLNSQKKLISSACANYIRTFREYSISNDS